MDEMNKHLDAYLAERKEKIAGVCPDPHALEDYCAGNLDKEKEEMLQDHITFCAACRRRILELERIEHPLTWEAFKDAQRPAEVYELQAIVLYINGSRVAERRLDEEGSAEIQLNTAETVDFLEIQNDQGQLLHYIDPALYPSKNITSTIHLRGDRRIFTRMQWANGRTYIKVHYQDQSKAPTGMKKFLAALERSAWIRVPAWAALGLALVFISSLIYKERRLDDEVNRLLRETVPNYERQLAALQQEKAQWRKRNEDNQAEISQWRQRLLEPHIAPTTYGVIGPESRSGVPQGEPLLLQFADQTPSRILTFSFPVRDLKTYAVEIEDKEGARLWASGTQPIMLAKRGEAYMSFSLTLRKDFLALGRYRLKIYGQNLKKHLIAEYPLHIASQ